MITKVMEESMRRRTQLTMHGIGTDKLYDWNLEAGVTFVWR